MESHFYGDVVTVVESSILVIAALFPIVDPIGGAATFLVLADHLPPKLHPVISKRIAIFSFFLLFVSMTCGGKVLSLFGITLYSVQIGGGLAFAVSSWRLLDKDTDHSAAEPLGADYVAIHAFYPFTFPFTVGPGSISVAIALGAHLPAQLRIGSFLAPQILVAALAGTSLLSLSIYFCYRWARKAEGLLGMVGTTAFLRLSCFISLCIGVQVVASGVQGFIKSLH